MLFLLDNATLVYFLVIRCLNCFGLFVSLEVLSNEHLSMHFSLAFNTLWICKLVLVVLESTVYICILVAG